MKPLYIIDKDGHGQGGFLCPPGHWDLAYVLLGYYRGRRKADADSYSGIGYALDDESGASEQIRQRVREIMAAAVLTDSDLWERMIYGYFRNCYSLDGITRDVQAALIDPANSLPPDHHLAVLCIREYFPDHQPRLNLIKDPGKGYGSYPCVKCGQAVQYEARADALTVYPSLDPECTKGGKHQI